MSTLRMVALLTTLLSLFACQGKLTQQPTPTQEPIPLPPTDMIITGSGYIGIGDPSKRVEVSIDWFNAHSGYEWVLLNTYVKHDMITALWQHKETGEEVETIGIQPPSEMLIIPYSID